MRIRMDLYLYEGEWDDVRQSARIPKDREKEARVNAILAKYRGRVEELFYEARMSGMALSPQQFAEELDNKPALDSLVEFIEKEIVKERVDKEISTVNLYRSTVMHLKAYKASATFADISFDFVQGFDRYMRMQKLADNTRAKYHTIVRKFVLLAKSRRRRVQNPYAEFKIRSVDTERIWLNVEEVDTLVRLYRSGTLGTGLQQSLRQFLFYCIASVRVGDIRRLTRKDVEGDMLILIPKKTKRLRKVVPIPLSVFAKQLIAEGRGKGEFLFEDVADQTVNTRIKEVMKIAGIKKHITNHCGRHTFGFLYLLMGGKVEELQEIMGHSKIETTMIYTHTDHDRKMAGVRKFDEVFRVA